MAGACQSAPVSLSLSMPVPVPVTVPVAAAAPRDEARPPVPGALGDAAGCAICEPGTAFVLQEGNWVCSKCNSIIARYLDHGAEWRLFSADDARGPDPTRCCPPTSVLLPTLGCMVGRRSGGAAGGGAMHMLHKYQAWNALSYRQRTLCGVFDQLSQQAAQYMLPSCILEEAKTMYKQVTDAQVLRGVNRSALIATCLYMACKTNGVPRSVREVADMFGLPLHMMTKGCRVFLDAMNSLQVMSSCPDSFIARFCSRLELGDDVVKQVRAVVARAEEMGVASDTTPPTLVAGAIMLVCGDKGRGGKRGPGERYVSKAMVAQATLLAPATIGKCMARMTPHRAALLEQEDH